jgi:hypothetical protein
MNSRVLTALVLLAGTGLWMRQSTSQGDSPKEVVEQFVGMEVQGQRLTKAGWQRASVFLVRPDPIPAYPKVFVIGQSFTTWEPVFEANGLRARVDVEVVPKGHIDSKVGFMPVGQTFQKSNVVFHLSYEARREEVGGAEVSEPARWRIEGPNDTVMLSVSAAIRHVRRIADSSKDPLIRKNAAETLTNLENLR